LEQQDARCTEYNAAGKDCEPTTHDGPDSRHARFHVACESILAGESIEHTNGREARDDTIPTHKNHRPMRSPERGANCSAHYAESGRRETLNRPHDQRSAVLSCRNCAVYGTYDSERAMPCRMCRLSAHARQHLARGVNTRSCIRSNPRRDPRYAEEQRANRAG
jgi:hypothetical protein